MTNYFISSAAAAKTASLLLVVAIVVASTQLLLVVYNNQQTATTAATTMMMTTTTGPSGKKTNHHGLSLHSASGNSIAQRQQQRQQQRRRIQQQLGGEEQVTVGGWNNYEDMTIPTTTTNSESNPNNNWNADNSLYETEMMTEESEQLYSSSPFRPRQYTGTGTSYLHFKNSKEQDTDGHTTFPPTFAPIVQQSGWFQPTIGPTLLMEKTSLNPTSMSGEPTLGPTVMMENSRVPTKYPIMITFEPTKEEEEVVVKEENEWLETDEPTLSPSGAPIADPTGSPSKLPTLVPTLGVSSLSPFLFRICLIQLWLLLLVVVAYIPCSNLSCLLSTFFFFCINSQTAKPSPHPPSQ